MRGCRNALEAALQPRGDAHDLVDAYEYAEKVIEVKRQLMEWLGPIVWEYYAATEGSGTLVSPHQWLNRPGTVGKVNRKDVCDCSSRTKSSAGPLGGGGGGCSSTAAPAGTCANAAEASLTI